MQLAPKGEGSCSTNTHTHTHILNVFINLLIILFIKIIIINLLIRSPELLAKAENEASIWEIKLTFFICISGVTQDPSMGIHSCLGGGL